MSLDKKQQPTCGDWWELGDPHEAAVSSVSCELPAGHAGPHQQIVRWEHTRTEDDLVMTNQVWG